MSFFICSYSLFAITYGNGGHFNCSIKIQELWYMYDGLGEYNCAGSWLKKQQRQQPMPGYRQSHALYVLHEIKWIVCQCIVFMEKCISVPHDRENNFCFPSHEKAKKNIYEHNENPRKNIADKIAHLTLNRNDSLNCLWFKRYI